MTQERNGTQIVGVQMTHEEVAAIDEAAAKNERSRSGEIRMAIKAWLSKQETETTMASVHTK